MDDICQIIRKQYPINYSVLPNGGRSLSISYEDHLPGQTKASVQSTLDRFMLPVCSDGAELNVEVCMSLCPGTKEDCLTLRGDDFCFYYPDGDPALTLAWTLYGLTQELPCLSLPYPKKLLAVMYSAEQQGLAASLLATVQYWENSASANALAAVLTAVLREDADTVFPHAPLFGARPLTEEGWQLMQQSRYLFAKKREWEIQSLVNALYGQGSYLKELDAFCRALNNNDYFQQTLSETFEELMKELYARPLADVEFRLNEAVAIRREELDREETQARKAVKAELSAKAIVRRVEPSNIFERLDNESDKLARVQIEKLLLGEIQNKLSEKLEQTLPAAQKGVWSWHRSLQDFCQINPAENRMMIGWDWFSSPQTQPLLCGITNWNPQMLRTLQVNAGTWGHYVTNAWFCAPHIRELCSIAPDITWPVRMTGTPMVALMEDIVEV